MTFQDVLPLVIGQRHVAVLAFCHPTAGFAHHKGREAATVEEEYHLLLSRKSRAYPVPQRRRKQGSVAVAELRDHVHYLHLGERVRRDALFQADEVIFPLRGVEIALHGGSRRAQHQRRPARRRTKFGNLLGVVTGVGLADVARVVLLVDYDDADVRKRREYGGTRSHRYPCLSVFQALPFVISLPRV